MEQGLQSNEYYFNLRAHFTYHEPMYKDYQAMNVWRDAISYNPLQFRDKIVLEIGTGPGLFSLLAARAGASHVYTWEPTSIAKSAEEIVKLNKYEDVITVLTGPITELKIPEKVDVIFTTVFGYSLFLDSLLPYFIYSRDNYLKEGGILIPSKANIHLSSCIQSMFPNQASTFWKNVYDFDFTPIEKDDINNATVSAVSTTRMKTTKVVVAELDFSKISYGDLTIDSPFTIQSLIDHDIDSFLIWFDLQFPVPNRQLELSTSPFDPDTHWNQITLKLPEPVHVMKDDTISGMISIYHESKELRPIGFDVSYSVNSGSSQKISYVFQ